MSSTPAIFELFGQADTTTMTLDGTSYWIQNSGASYAISQVGPDTLQFQVEAGDVWAPIDPATKNRSEIASTQQIAAGTPINVSYVMNVLPGAANTAAWCVLGQFHQNDGPNTPANSPPFAISLNGEEMAVGIGYTGANGVVTYLNVFSDTANIVRGENYAMNISVTFDPNGNGHLVVTRNGVTIVNYSGPLGYTTEDSVYWKEGIYRAASSTTMAVDYSNLSITTGTPVSTATHNSTQVYSTYSGTGAVLSTTTNEFDAFGNLLKSSVVSANGQTQISTYAITGEPYTSTVQVYSSSGALISQINRNANGTQEYTLTVSSTGTTVINQYDSNGQILSSSTKNADGSHTYTVYQADHLHIATYAAYNAAGLITEFDVNNPDGSRVRYLHNVTGEPYTSEMLQYNSAGVATAINYINTNGTLYYKMAIASNGATIQNYYDTKGNLLTASVKNMDGSRTIATYTAGNPNLVTYQVYNTSGTLVLNEAFHSDGTSTIQHADIVGEPYTSDSINYSATGVVTSDAQYSANGKVHFGYTLSSTGVATSNYYDGSGNILESKVVSANGAISDTAFQAGVTLTSGGPNDTMRSFGGDTFVFNSHFTNDTINGFHAGSGSGHDIISISSALASSYSDLSMTSSGANVSIHVTPTDVLTLTNVSLSSLTAQDFQFHS